MKLVDTLAEQAALESLIETAKPPLPADCRHLHYLLATPFRYGAPYPSGSRFRRAGLTPGVFYGSKVVATAVAEMAFHRLLFFGESPATPWPSDAGDYTGFAVKIRTASGLDLTAAPLNVDRARWTHPVDYAPCQALAETARAAGVDLLRCASAREANGINIAVLACRAFAAPDPIERQSWRIQLSEHGVRAICDFPEARMEYNRLAFAADPRIAALRWERPVSRS